MGDSRKANDNLSWTDMLREVRIAGVEEVPEGWKTTNDIAEEAGMSASHTNKILRVAVKQGRAEMKSFSVKRNNRLLPIPHYRMTE